MLNIIIKPPTAVFYWSKQMTKPDWEAIESAYRAGLMSLREIASQHKCLCQRGRERLIVGPHMGLSHGVSQHLRGTDVVFKGK